LAQHRPYSLPVALRPYTGEALSSWVSRTAAVYGCTIQELLSEFAPFDRDTLDRFDVQLSSNTLSCLPVSLKTDTNSLEACTLAGSHPEWLNRWISLAEPLWNVTEHRTVTRFAVIPAICPLCLAADLRNGRSQYRRLEWYCAITTVCPSHRTPLVSCCRTKLWHQSVPTKGTLPTARAFCLCCRSNLDRPQGWDSTVDQHAISALLSFESMFRTAIVMRCRPAVANSDYDCTNIIEPAQDVAWALMRPVSGTSRRVLHFMQTPQFKMPFGFNTPVEATSWLSSGSLRLRRAILAVIASLLLPTSLRSTLVSEAGRGKSFWISFRSLLSPGDQKGFRQRAARWNPSLVEAMDFYW
jgi:TniQ